VDLDIRPATRSDLPALASVARASGLSDIEGGADPRYITYLIEHGRLLVAVVQADIIGYAGSVQVGATTMLTDLFVRPDVQSGGTGAVLLASLFAGAGDRMTHSSSDPRAVALYARAGMTPMFPILYLAGDPGRLTGVRSEVAEHRPSAAPAATDSTEAAATELTITGDDRATTYAYWVARPNSFAFVLGDRLGAGVIGGEGDQFGVTHLCAGPDVDPIDAVVSAVAAVPGTMAHLSLPGPHPALRTLLDAGFRITDTDTFMTSGPNPYATGLAVGSPGLC
jgi:GNAT superfamily N-acetyltransferase